MNSLSKIHIGDSNYDVILLFMKRNPKVYHRRYDVIPSGDLPFARDRMRNPLFKPTFTISILLQMFSNENDLVLDSIAGFGSIPMVAEFSKRRWIAFEIDERKFNIAINF
jgi:DNA modification methylase